MQWLADLIPPPHTRGPLDRYSFFPDLLAPILCYYATAILVLIPDTFAIRLSLLPLTLWLAFRGATRLDLTLGYHDERLIYLNQGLVLTFTTLAMRVIIWTFQQKPYRRAKSMQDVTPQFYDDATITGPQSAKQIAIDAWDLSCNLRGCGWNWSRYLQVPPETRQVNSTQTFVASTTVSLVKHAIMLDLLHYSVQWFAPSTVGSAKGGTIFDANLPPLQRYLRSSSMSFLSGLTVYNAIQLGYHISTLLGILVFRQHPSLWPPAFKSPWLSTSLTEFWATRWHQLFRDNFISIGSYPFSLVAGRAGGVLGAFFISGLLHDFGLWGMGNGNDFVYVVGFFMINGIGVILEHLWRHFAGYRVQGWIGSVWTILWVVGWGNMVVDAWARKGLVGSAFVPQHLRPSTFLFGALQ